MEGSFLPGRKVVPSPSWMRSLLKFGGGATNAMFNTLGQPGMQLWTACTFYIQRTQIE